MRPASLRNWAGRTAYDAGTPIEDVARLLGLRTLDAAAEDIALNWRIDNTGPTSGPAGSPAPQGNGAVVRHRTSFHTAPGTARHLSVVLDNEETR